MKKEQKPKSFPNKITWVKVILRKASLRWPTRTLALQKARIERGKYKCSQCESVVSRKDIQMDHKDPVIPLEGSKMHPTRSKEIDLNEWIDRLLCDTENWSCLCIKCHESKTTIENEMRSFYKKKKRKKK